MAPTTPLPSLPPLLRRPSLSLVVATAVVVLVAAGFTVKRLSTTGRHPIPYRLLDAGHVELPPIGKRVRLQKSLDLLLGGRRAVIPEGYETVVISPGPRSSSGYSLRVLSVTEERSRIVVRVEEESPQLGQRVQPVVSYPYRIVLIPWSGKRVLVKWLSH